jgi:hypothetical protein
VPEEAPVLSHARFSPEVRMGFLFVIHRPRRWCTTNKEVREVKGLRQYCSAVAQPKAENIAPLVVPA